MLHRTSYFVTLPLIIIRGAGRQLIVKIVALIFTAEMFVGATFGSEYKCEIYLRIQYYMGVLFYAILYNCSIWDSLQGKYSLSNILQTVHLKELYWHTCGISSWSCRVAPGTFAAYRIREHPEFIVRWRHEYVYPGLRFFTCDGFISKCCVILPVWFEPFVFNLNKIHTIQEKWNWQKIIQFIH